MFPKPQHAQVIRYSYLWNREHLRGQEEGMKDRPCAIVLMLKSEEGRDVLTVLPVTHTPPSEADLAIEIPPAVKRRLKLDGERSWIMLTEANRFTWPGPDLRMAVNGDPSSSVYGLLPNLLYERVRTMFIVALESGKAKLIPRSE